MKSDKKYADLNSFISFLKNTAPNGTYPGDEINYVAENIQKDADVILYASLSYDKAIQFADNKLKSDKIFLENVLRNNPNSIQYIDNKFLEIDKVTVMVKVNAEHINTLLDQIIILFNMSKCHRK